VCYGGVLPKQQRGEVLRRKKRKKREGEREREREREK
jgi:hypothetical protein